MRKTLMAAMLAAPLMALSMAASAADPVVGRWKTIDSETGSRSPSSTSPRPPTARSAAASSN